MIANSTDKHTSRGRLVWDLPTRLFHWCLVLALGAQYATAQAGGSWMAWHFGIGYFVIGLIVFRVLWGFFGSTHARFKNFLKGPGFVADYFKRLRKTGNESVHSVGHNPLGALMVLLMLSLIAAQAMTGLFSTDDTTTVGPFAATLSQDLADTVTNWHHGIFNVILGAVALHVLAIAYYTVIKREPLVPAMIHGRKPISVVSENDAIKNSALARAAIIALIATVTVYALQSMGSPKIDTSATTDDDDG